MIKVLCIDDCSDITSMLKEFLVSEMCEVFVARNSQEAFSELQKIDINIIILDRVLPGEGGLSILERLKKEYPSIPVIMISGNCDVVDKIVGIEAGADDYLSKPFDLKELLARMKRVLKRSQKSDVAEHNISPKNSVIKFGDWFLDKEQYQVYDCKQQKADLTTQEFLLLERLVSNPQKVFSREQLFSHVNNDTIDAYDRSIDIKIARIRAKLGDSIKDPKYIKTVRNIGYVFIGRIDSSEKETTA